MQERAAAVYVTFFLVIAAVAYAFIVAAPSAGIEGRINGFWGVVYVSGSAAVLLAALAFLPSKH